MKKSMIFLGMLSIGYANAQYDGKVGVNTDKPQATLDVIPETTNLNGTTNEGIIAPKLSKTRIANIESSKLTEGTLVYATDDATSPISAYTGSDVKVAKITEKGYYYYDGTEWVKAGSGATSADIRNIYTHDGTLTENRIVDLDSKALTFRDKKTDNFIKFGIGADSPAFHIQGHGGHFGDDIIIDSFSGDNIHGFGLITNRYRGTATAPEDVKPGDILGNYWFKGYYNSKIHNGVILHAVVAEQDATSDILKTNFIMDVTNNVGISTNHPTNKLHVVATENPLRLEGLTEGVGTTLVVDANGVVKKGAAVSGEASKIASTTNMECNEENRGKMNFVKDVTIGSGTGDAFAICLKGTNGAFYWRYLYGASGVTNSTGNFGTGLQ